ncbi:MAG: YcxB family protein [Niabella sp.]
MTISFDYNKPQVIQALRYHFISKREMRLMIILVNVFAAFSLVLYIMGKITPMAFIINALLWIFLIISLWFVLPYAVYKRNSTFRNAFTMYFNENDFTLEHATGKRSWPYHALSQIKETPNFFHLYFDPRTFFLVPKSAFDTIEKLSTMRSIVNRLKMDKG